MELFFNGVALELSVRNADLILRIYLICASGIFVRTLMFLRSIISIKYQFGELHISILIQVNIIKMRCALPLKGGGRKNYYYCVYRLRFFLSVYAAAAEKSTAVTDVFI